jgi:hypothetical protein
MTYRRPFWMMVRCRCVACGNVTMQPADSQDPRYVKSWFCGCSPRPQGNALDGGAFGEQEQSR